VEQIADADDDEPDPLARETRCRGAELFDEPAAHFRTGSRMKQQPAAENYYPEYRAQHRRVACKASQAHGIGCEDRERRERPAEKSGEERGLHGIRRERLAFPGQRGLQQVFPGRAHSG